MLDILLMDMISERHGPGPKRYNKSQNKLIDYFYGSICINILKEVIYHLVDYKVIWLDLPTHTLYRHLPPPIHHPEARRLKTENPRLVARYIKILSASFHEPN